MGLGFPSSSPRWILAVLTTAWCSGTVARQLPINPFAPKPAEGSIRTQRDNTKVETADSSIGRADACGALPGPAGVDYSRLDKKCSSKPDYTTETTDGDGAENSDVDSASMECPPATGDERCPTINNQVRAVNGICFKYFCGMTGYWEIIGVRKSSSFGDCVKFCAETAGCQVCLRVVATHDCWLSSVYPEDPPVLTPGVNMAFPIESRA